jgi:hypothetical protein
MKQMGENDQEFLHVDNCKNGQPYRLRLLLQTVNDNTLKVHDYQGPQGAVTFKNGLDMPEMKACCVVKYLGSFCR